MHINPVKHALKEGKLQAGCSFGQLRSTEVARILAAAGFHWCYVDSEHGPFGLETQHELCRAAMAAGLMPIVRVADLQYSLVARALDNGAQGIIFPRVEDPELLARAVSWTKFPPKGTRGFGLTPSHVGYEKVTIPQIIEHQNANTLVVLQIETKLAVERRDELISVPGIDAIMVGPADLSISLGVAGEFDHPKMIEAIELVKETCLKHGVAPGIHTRALPLAKLWKDRGMKFLSCGAETGFLLESATATATALKA
ncbi:MAG: aldolase/citrate lyase family protein [Bryobacteraceae bacterium]|jgi:2-keto-3-deoxy-L-rhamnonate aldolase RhmA